MTCKRCLLYVMCASVILTGLLILPRPGDTHPLGNFSISHYTSLRIEYDAVEVHYLLDLAEIPTFQELQETGMVPESEHPSVRAYLAQRSEALKAGLLLEMNGQRLPLQVIASNLLFPPGAGGLPTLKLGLVYRAPFEFHSEQEPQQLSYRDNNFPGRAGWQEMIAVAGPEVHLVQSSVPSTDRSQALTDYPTDLLNSPPQVLAAQVVFHRASRAHAVAAALSPPTSFGPNQRMTPRQAFTELVTTQQLSFGMVCLALALAAGLGACHALEPGHGKTVVAAYLVGTRGTARQALYLGLLVTASHTAGVYVLGGVTLYASHYVLPERLYPWLGVTSGLLIALTGGYLLLRRYAGHHAAHDHAHTHAHEPAPMHHHEHHHPPSPHAHHHMGHHHAHPRPGEVVAWRDLLVLGVTGGLVPCPAALVVLLSALALHRVGFGLLLIVAFSVGLATVLVAIGLVMVYARQRLVHWQGDGTLLSRWLPLTSAGIVTVFGVAMVVQALRAAGVLALYL